MSAAQPEISSRPRGSSALVACLYLLAFAALAAAVVGGVLLLNVLGVTSWPSPEAKVRADMRVIGAAVARFRKDTGRDPETMTCLRERPFYASGWAGPYLLGDPLRDPWGNEYVYCLVERGAYEVISWGWDGMPGGVDESEDISSRRFEGPAR